MDMKDLSESYTGTKKETVYYDNERKENCNCTTQPEKKQSKIKNEQQIQAMIEFENNLQNIVFVKMYANYFLTDFIFYLITNTYVFS